MRKSIFQAVFGLALMAGAAVAAPITIVFNNTPVSGTPGATVSLLATFTNTTGVTQNLNGDQFVLHAPFTLANVDDSAFFNNWPLALTAGQSFGSQTLFTVSIPVATGVGLYTGTFNLQGGVGANDLNLIGTSDFQINVVAPEPASGAVTLFGLIGFGGYLWRSRNSRATRTV